jgi:hypothetical protein
MKSLNEINPQSCAIFCYQIGKREGAELRIGRPEFVFFKIKKNSFKSAIFQAVTAYYLVRQTH